MNFMEPNNEIGYTYITTVLIENKKRCFDLIDELRMKLIIYLKLEK